MTVTTRIRPKTAFYAASLLLAGIAPQAAQAWGGTAHQAIAMVAEDDLLKKLRAHYSEADVQIYWNKIRTLIANDAWLAQHPEYRTVANEYHLADVASWADWIRGQDTNADGKRDGDNIADHSVRLPIDNSAPDDPACTGKDNTQFDMFPGIDKKCADQAVTDFAPAIGNTAYSTAVQQASLKYVVHLVGDLHQPLHGADPIGYNYVSIPNHPELEQIPASARWPGDEVANPHFWYNIHAVWDSTIVADYMKYKGFTTARQFADFLILYMPANPSVAGTPRNWAEESKRWAAVSVYSDAGYPTPSVCWSSTDSAPPGGAVCNKNSRLALDANYTTRKAQVVVARLQQAGLRLSCVLYKSLTGTDLCNP